MGKAIYFLAQMYYNGLVKWGIIISAQYLFSFAKGIVMLKLLAVFAAALVLAYISEQNTKAALASGQRYVAHKDWAYVLLVTILVLFAGLRTSYNDTWNYIRGFQNATSITEWISDIDSFSPFKNPLFTFYQSLLKTYTDNSQILIFSLAAFTQICILRFFKRYYAEIITRCKCFERTYPKISYTAHFVAERERLVGGCCMPLGRACSGSRQCLRSSL